MSELRESGTRANPAGSNDVTGRGLRQPALVVRARVGDQAAWSQLLEQPVGPDIGLARAFDAALRDLSAFEGDVLRADLHPARPSSSAVAAALTEAYGRLLTAEAVREFRSSARLRVREGADTLRLIACPDRCDALANLVAGGASHRHTPVPDEVVAQVARHREECLSCGAWIRTHPLTAAEKQVRLERVIAHFALPPETTLPRWLAGPRAPWHRRLFSRS